VRYSAKRALGDAVARRFGFDLGDSRRATDAEFRAASEIRIRRHRVFLNMNHTEPMPAMWIAGLLGMCGLMGCEPSNGVRARDARGVAMSQTEGVRAGEARVVDERINPRVPVHVTAEGGAITVRFAHPRDVGALARLNPESLTPVSPEERVEAEHPTAPATGAVRVVMRDGTFVVCWRRGNVESGYRLMAQAWTADGAPLGQPVPISPPDADVPDAPELLAIDGEHAVATFVAMSGGRFRLLAVPLEVL
jgi:hypothetical protein